MSNPRLIIGISGASGIIYGIRLLEVLQSLGIETHLVVSKAGQLTRHHETNLTKEALKALASVYHPIQDVSACISSGSFKTLGMIIAPCSMNTLGEIANGISSNLLTRAADVVLKERRRLVLLPREAPLNLVHLQNMVAITQMGGIVFPPVPAFYTHPTSLQAIVDETVGRVLDLFQIDSGMSSEWSAH